MRPPARPWRILNQSHTPDFQRMLTELASELGPARLLTGTPYPAEAPLVVERGPSYDRRSTARRALSWLAYTIVATWKVLVTDPPGTFVLAVTNPPTLPHVAWLAHRLRGTRYALLIWDLYPEHLVEAGVASERSALYRMWAWLNRRALRDASAVMTLGNKLAEGLRRQMRDPSAPIQITPIAIDTRTYHPRPKADNPFAREHGQTDRLTVLSIGNIGHSHGTEIIPRVAALLRDEPGVSFLVVGDGLGLPQLVAGVRALGLANVEFLPWQPWDRLPWCLAAAEIGLVTQAGGTAHLSVPSKTYALLASGCAVVAVTDADSDLARLVRDGEVGAVCTPDDAEQVAAAIRALARDPARLQATRSQARALAERHYDHDAVRQRFAATLRRARDGGP